MFKFDQVVKIAATGWKLIKDHRIAIYRTVEAGAIIGAGIYGIKTARRTLCKIEDAQFEKKEEPLTAWEKTGIVVKDQYVTILLLSTALAARTGIEFATGREMYRLRMANKDLIKDNKSLMDQLADAAVMYNTVNSVKDAMQKKVEDTEGKAVVDDINDSVSKDILRKTVNKDAENAAKVYSFSEKKLNEANDTYLRTGNPDYKVQKFWFPFLGQEFLSYNKKVEEGFENFREKIKDTGFGTITELAGMIGACESEIGDYMIYTLEGTYFDAYVRSDDYDGEAVRVISLTNLPIYDRKGRWE